MPQFHVLRDTHVQQFMIFLGEDFLILFDAIGDIAKRVAP